MVGVAFSPFLIVMENVPSLFRVTESMVVEFQV